MFQAFKNLSKNLSKVDIIKLTKEVFDESMVQSQMIDFNNQQMDKGILVDGGSIGNYSQVSVTKYGKEAGPIKLFDTGETRESQKIIVGDDAVYTNINTTLHGENLSYLFEESIGLTKESMNELIPEIKERIVEKFKIQILK